MAYGRSDFINMLSGGVQPGSLTDTRNRLNQAQQAGIFDPFGSPRLRDLLRRRAMILQQARGQQAQGAATLYGLDPMQRRAALAAGNIGGAGDTANALNQAEYGISTANQDRLWNMLQNQQNFYQQQALMRQAQKQQSSGGLGQLVGTGLGLLAGGPAGAALGGTFGGMFGGGGYSPYSFGQYMSQNPYGGYYGIGG